MKHYSTFVKAFSTEFGYPSEAIIALTDGMKTIEANSEAFALFDGQVRLYKKSETFNHPQTIEAAKMAAELSGVHSYTAQLLLYICFAEHTKEKYKAKGIDDSIYIDSMSDLKWKLHECYAVHGIWGSFVAFWFDRFFDLTRFALGRLQFEIVEFASDYEKGNDIIRKGEAAVNIHIPSNGPLLVQDCEKSFTLAADFFKDYFKDKEKVVFQCNSWLLYPKHREFLPQYSNILKFMDMFDIYASNEDPKNADAWRIFWVEDRSNIDLLPTKTSIQRAYVEWFKSGGTMGGGQGVRFW